MTIPEIRVRLVATLTAVFAFQAAAVLAADQTEHLSRKPTPLIDPSGRLDVAGATLTRDQARSLISQAIPGAPVDNDNFYCLIHVLRWGADNSHVDKSNWFVYRNPDSWSAESFRGSRIYGSDRVAVLYIHVNVPMARNDAALQRGLLVQAKDDAELVANQTNADPVTGLITATSVRGRPLAVVGDAYVEADYIGVDYQIDVAKKLPAPVQNLTSVLGLLQAASAATLTMETTPGALMAGQIYDIAAVPSDITVTGTLTAGPSISPQTVALGTKTFDDEGRYFWDVSVGLPLKSVTDVNLDSTDPALLPKSIDRQNLFAVLNIFFVPVDTKDVQRRLIPHLVVGVAIAKRPLDKVLVGGSVGLSFAEVFAGWRWDRTPRTDPSSATGTTIDASSPYARSVVVGLNVPVRTITDYFKRGK